MGANAAIRMQSASRMLLMNYSTRSLFINTALLGKSSTFPEYLLTVSPSPALNNCLELLTCMSFSLEPPHSRIVIVSKNLIGLPLLRERFILQGIHFSNVSKWIVVLKIWPSLHLLIFWSTNNRRGGVANGFYSCPLINLIASLPILKFIFGTILNIFI